MRFKIRRGGASGRKGPHVRPVPWGSWRREAIELGALFMTAGLAHVFSAELGHRESGSVVLVGLGGVLCIIVVVHMWWAHQREHRRPHAPGPPEGNKTTFRSARLWRVRAQVRETPGQLAALAAAIAATGGNIMSLNSQPDADGTVDELYVQMPTPVMKETLERALTLAGGRAVTVVRATMHELVDPITRTLLLASSVKAEPHRLSAALATMLDADLVSAEDRHHDGRETLSLVSPAGGPIRLHRPGMPFTASETARALAMLEFARLVDDPSPT
ncbi:hypothetical protein [Actinomadura alba]|uniref:ACT domain-containing protein n=1 Tax=Actinomadura alba TaxID=406431 RepID=A0ABR7LRM4_9ACTN|nr:hypothetical protein [Actinomadura alba]MBC6467495.1 hypothetical protein [Actinomadura alba]